MVSDRDTVLIVDDEPDLVNLFTDALLEAMVSDRDAVLIVDDEPDLVNLFTDALIKAGDLNAIGFDNPLTALEYISENHLTICLVVTDWKMPDMNVN